jgi:hypothetical protein
MFVIERLACITLAHVMTTAVFSRDLRSRLRLHSTEATEHVNNVFQSSRKTGNSFSTRTCAGRA